MSDTRRRRKQSGGSDDLSDSYEPNATKETQSNDQTDGHRDSEYDTAGSDRDSDVDSQDGGERESGDGQEEDKPQRKLDDDEDRRNPQYIPKRGTFYEHDDRTTEETSENTTEAPPEREIKEKKVWKDKEDKWNHDRYNDDEQAPKSHEELIAVYGYDIRNEEGPPRARRRRRYGRGPNKYTRNWEDEDAYGKTAPSITSGKNTGKRTSKSGEEFPALGGVDKEASTESVDEPVITSAWYSNKNKTPIKQQNFPPLQSQQDNNQKPKSGSSNTHTNENRAPNEPTNPAWKKEAKGPARNLSPSRSVVGVGGIETEKVTSAKPVSREAKDVPKKRQVQESVSLAASRVRGRGFRANPSNNLVGNRSADLKPKGRGYGLIGVDTKRNNTASLHEDEQHQHLANDAKLTSPNDASYHPRQTKNFYVQSPGQQRPNTVPPRMQQQQQHPQHHQQPPLQAADPQAPQVHPQQADVAGNRPKRYSSLRQRPTIPEVPGQQQPPYTPQHPQHGFYPPQGFPQGHFEQPTPVGNSAAPMTGQPVIPLAPGGQPSGYAPPFLVPPPQFIAPQAPPPNIINYVPTPAGPAFQPTFQGYQGYNPTVQAAGPPPPPELFQPQGCTYYSPAQQQQQQGAPMRRPKAAIPILPPPDTTNQYQHHNHQTTVGRGKTSHHRHSGGAENTPASTTLQPSQQVMLQASQQAMMQPSQQAMMQQSQQAMMQQSQQAMMQQSQQIMMQPSQQVMMQPSQQVMMQPSQQVIMQPSEPAMLQPLQPAMSQQSPPVIALLPQPEMSHTMAQQSPTVMALPSQPAIPQQSIPLPAMPQQSEPVMAQPSMQQPSQSVMAQPSQPEMPQPSQSVMAQPSQTEMPQPSHSVMAQPSQPEMPQPSQSVMAQPSQTEMPQPSQSVMAQPSQPEMPQPSQSVMAQPSQPEMPPPSQSVMAQPSQPEIPQPSQSVMAQPSQPEIPQPSQSVMAQPSQPEIPQPSQSVMAPPSQPEIPQPSQSVMAQPSQPEMPQPSQSVMAQPSQPEIPQPSQSVMAQPSQPEIPQPSQSVMAQPSQPEMPQPSQSVMVQASQSVIAQPLQPEMPQPTQLTISQSLSHQPEAPKLESTEPDNQNFTEVRDNAQFDNETPSALLNEEKLPVPPVTEAVTTEPELPSITEPSVKLEPKVELPIEHGEVENTCEPVTEITSDTMLSNEIVVERETTKETTPNIEPIALESNDKMILVGPEMIESEANDEQPEVTKTELNVIPDKPVIEEAAA